MIDGPRLPALSGTTRHLVVFLHGFGADGRDLIDIGHSWQARLPDTAFVSPHAPEPCEGAPAGRQWFGLTFRDPGERWRGVTAARWALDDFLDHELQAQGLADADLALVGFSQGTMMALHVAPRRARAAAAVVGYSGVLVTPPGQAPDTMAGEVTARPPVLLVHGAADPVVPAAALSFSAAGLRSLGLPVEDRLRPGLGHGIDAEGLELGATMLAARLVR